MDIIGREVFHRNLKMPNHKGTIIGIDVEERFIDIAFENDDVQFRRFLVPQSFIPTNQQPALLSTLDAVLIEWIDFAKAKCHCAVCNTQSKQLKLFGDFRVCPKCEKEIVSCHECGNKVLRKNAKEDPWWSGYHFCTECFRALFKTCSICGRIVSSQSIAINRFISADQSICNVCVDELYVHCDECNEIFPREDLQVANDYKYCPECYSKKVGICKECNGDSAELKNGLCPQCSAHKAYIDYLSSPDFLQQKTVRIRGEKQELRDVKTKRLMSRLNKSCLDDPFDLLILEGFINYNGRLLDIILVPDMPEKHYNTLPFSCTMTELKNDSYYQIRRTIEKILDDENSIKNKIDDNHNFIIMYKAYVIHAMTYNDMHYGDRWYGRDYCEEGNKYGDTSNFYVVGAIETINPKKQKYIYIPFFD